MTFFVSHAYADHESLQLLLKATLPEHGAPIVFPPAEHIDMVSEVIMPKIKSSDGLIYIRSRTSLDSFWVAFERNYALRLGKPVYAFEPSTGRFERDTIAPIDPTVAVAFNLFIPRDSFMVSHIALHLHDEHRFEIRGKDWQLIDNDFRQMIDSCNGLQGKIAAGALVVVFLSNDSICSGSQDYASPYEVRRAQRDFETPRVTSEKFALFPRDRTFVVWLDLPDRQRIEAALSGYRDPYWVPYAGFVRAALAEGDQCVVVNKSLKDADSVGYPSVLAQQAYERARSEMRRRPMDEIMVRAIHLAHASNPDFRMKLSTGLGQAN